MDEDRELGEARSAYQSGRVRIIGAEPASRAADAADAGGEPADADAEGPRLFDFEAESAGPPPDPDDPFGGGSELPHWTEAPTGEVPAVLARPGDDEVTDPWSTLPAPTWREEQSDWEADTGRFEPAMLSDEVKLGSLDDSGEAERQPWTFDLPGESAPGAEQAEPADEAGMGAFNEDTLIIPAVGSHATTGGPPDVAPGDPEPAAPEEPVPAPMVVDDFATGEGAVDADALWTAEEQTPPAEAPEPPRRRRSRPEPADAGDGPEPASRGILRRPAAKAPRGGSRAADPAAPATERASSGRDLPVAIAVGVVLGILALVFFKLGTVTAMLITTVVVVVAVAEGYAAFRRSGFHPATLLGMVATVCLMVATYNKGLAALPLVLVLMVAFTFLWYMIGVEPGADPVQGSASTILVFSWVAVFGSFAALLLSPALFPDRHGIAFLLGAIITSVACDVGALFVGARFGRRPLAPQISPNKTWEGVVGGAVAAILVAVIVVHFIHPWSLGTAAALGIVVAVVSPLGDLCESMIKRHLGLKDMGRILPGHGGLLDRVDGLLFVVPATYFLVRALNVG